MDFNFVYAVAQTIRDIKRIFDFTSPERIWIFTHSIEFFNILKRNKIFQNAFIISPGSIQRFNNQLMMPYENHLLDLLKIATGEKEPNHTTGNSIRHIIETIAKFEDPETNLVTYVRNIEILSKNSCIFSLCQDLSHGNIRFELPYSGDMLRNASKDVINFVSSRYPGQIENIKHITNNY